MASLRLSRAFWALQQMVACCWHRAVSGRYRFGWPPAARNGFWSVGQMHVQDGLWRAGVRQVGRWAGEWAGGQAACQIPAVGR